jgi:hypothetical protein
LQICNKGRIRDKWLNHLLQSPAANADIPEALAIDSVTRGCPPY